MRTTSFLDQNHSRSILALSNVDGASPLVITSLPISSTQNALDVNVTNSSLTVSATNPSVGTTGSGVPGSESYIGGKDGGGNLQGFQTNNGAGGDANTLDNAFPVALRMYNGTNWDRIRGDTTNGLWVNIKNNVALPANQSVNLNQVGGAAFALGQQLAAVSLPIVLTAAQLSTLTPPAALTNFSLETGGNLAILAGIVSASKAAVKMADGDLTTLGNKADAANTATDITAISIMSVLKEISKMVQAPASTPVTGTFWQATQPVSLASLPALATGSNTIGSVKITDGTNTLPITTGTNKGVYATITDGTNTMPTMDAVGRAGLVTLTDGTNKQTFMSTTTVSKFGADVNILSILGTAPTTAGKIDVKGADGDVFIRQATASNLKGQMQVQDSSGNGISSTSNALDVNIKSETAPAVTLTRVAITASSSGDNTLIAAVVSKKIYVIAFELSFSGTVNAKFTDGAGGTNLGGLYYGVANAGAADSMSPDMKLAIPSPYLWAGSTNTALILNLSGATAVGGAITYFTV